jgi:hypothetical protein
MTKYRWQGWRRMRARNASDAEKLLKSQERWCMNACSRFLNREALEGRVWLLDGIDGEVCAIVVYARQAVLPVLCGLNAIPTPNFLYGFFGIAPVHSVQGRTEDAAIMQTAMEEIGLLATQSIDFDVMCIDSAPYGYQTAGPAGLLIRKPERSDINAIARLHAAYEQEEVLTAALEFNPVVSRLNTERIFTKEQMLVAELGGRLIGKINTNAAAFSRCQIGGVYVHPDYRGLGIARRMAGEFSASLVAQGMGISLFVKKSNVSARQVYQRIGFSISGDYRVSYF